MVLGVNGAIQKGGGAVFPDGVFDRVALIVSGNGRIPVNQVASLAEKVGVTDAGCPAATLAR